MRARRSRARRRPSDPRPAPTRRREGGARARPRSKNASRSRLPQRLERGQGARHDGLVALGLDARAEQLDVPPPGVAGGLERPADARERDVAIAHHYPIARLQRADLEVVHLHDRDAIGALGDVAIEAALDPGVVHLEHDTEPWRIDLVDEVERLVEG